MARNVGAFGRIEFRPRVLRDVSRIDPSTELFGRPPGVPADPLPDGIHPHRQLAGRAGGGARRPARRHPVLAVDGVDTVDRGGRGRLRRSQVVPGLHLARPGTRPRARRALGGGRVRGAVADRRHRRARATRARRPPGLHAAAEDRPRDDLRRRVPPRLDARLPPCRTDHVLERRRQGRRRRQDRGFTRRPGASRSSIRRCRGTTSSGCDRSGTARSC